MAATLIAHSLPMKRLIADRGYDANALRKGLRQTGAKPVIPGRRSRMMAIDELAVNYDPCHNGRLSAVLLET